MLSRLRTSRLPPQSILKFLICTTGALSLTVALTASLPIINYLAPLMGISSFGAQHFFIWQLFTHLLIIPTGGLFSLNFVLSLFFSLYFLWIIGSQMIARLGTKRFLTLYIGSGILSGGAVMLLLGLFPSLQFYTGCQASLMALLLSWVFLNPEARVLLFLTIPVRAKWLIAGFAAINLLSNFANGEFVLFAGLTVALLFSYVFSLSTFEIHSPYPLLHAFERRFFNLLRKMSRQKSEPSEGSGSKIYDFKTGRVVLEDDECLNRKGKKSTSLLERLRLYKLTRGKRF